MTNSVLDERPRRGLKRFATKRRPTLPLCGSSLRLAIGVGPERWAGGVWLAWQERRVACSYLGME